MPGHGKGHMSGGMGQAHPGHAADRITEAIPPPPAPASQKPPGLPETSKVSMTLQWDDFFARLTKALETATVSAATQLQPAIEQTVEKVIKRLLCKPPAPPTRGFWSISKVDPMAKICDVTYTWVDSTTTDVTGQTVNSSVQPAGGTATPAPPQTLPPNQTQFVFTGVGIAAILSIGIAAVNAAGSSEVLSDTYTVPDLNLPAAPTKATTPWTFGNVRDDGTPAPATAPPTTPPVTEAPKA